MHPPPPNLACKLIQRPKIKTWEWLRTLYEVLHEAHTINFNDKIVFVIWVTNYVQKCPRNRCSIKKVWILRKNELNYYKLHVHYKTPFYPGDLVARSREQEISAIPRRVGIYRKILKISPSTYMYKPLQL